MPSTAARRPLSHYLLTRQIALGLFSLAIVLALFAACSPVQNPVLVIEGGTLIDGTGAAPLQDAVIVIEGDRITAVGQKGRVPLPPGAQVIPAEGKFILPGLIDMHVHWYDWAPELFLAHGVTSVVDLSSGDWQLGQKELIAGGRLHAPRLFNATATIGGRLLWDTPPNQPVDSVQTARRLVQQVGAGTSTFALTKVYTELTPGQLQAIVEESHKAGRNVIAHLGSIDARQAAELGVDALAHASGVALATIADPVRAAELRAFTRLGIAVDYPLYLLYHAFMEPARVDELVALLVKENVRLEPDLVNTARWGAPRREVWIAEDARLLEDPNLQYVPADNRMKAFYSTPLERLNGEQRRQLRRGYENLQSFIRKFVQAGGTVLAGSDTPSFVLPGISLHREMQLLVDAGLTPMQAIQAATRNNAEFLQERDMGTVEPGKLADVLIVRENPLADIGNSKTVDQVILAGKLADTAYHADFANPDPRPPRSVRFPHPKPFLRALVPITAQGLNQAVKLTLEGRNFMDGSVVEFDGVDVPAAPDESTLVPETVFQPVYTRLTANVPAPLLNRAGAYGVVVRNPPPEGGASEARNFFVVP